MKTVKLMTCNDAAQAHIIQGALENEGISSLLHWEYVCRACGRKFEQPVAKDHPAEV